MELQTLAVVVGIVSSLVTAVAAINKIGFAKAFSGMVFLCAIGGLCYLGATGKLKVLTDKFPLTLGSANRGSTSTGELSLTNTATRTGEFARMENGQLASVYQWTVHLTGPRELLQAVENVTYELPDSFLPPVRAGIHDAAAGFPLMASGWGEFDLKATVWFKDPRRRSLELRHWLRLSSAGF